jgi:hypothetical protein
MSINEAEALLKRMAPRRITSIPKLGSLRVRPTPEQEPSPPLQAPVDPVTNTSGPFDCGSIGHDDDAISDILSTTVQQNKRALISQEESSECSGVSSAHLSGVYGSEEDDPEFCRVCGSSRGWKTLCQCSYCFDWIHLRCYNLVHPEDPPLRKVPKGKFVCESVASCLSKYRKQVVDGYVHDDLGYLSEEFADCAGDAETNFSAYPGDDAFFQQIASSTAVEQSGATHAGLPPPLRRATAHLQRYARSKPAVLGAARLWGMHNIRWTPKAAKDYNSTIADILSKEGCSLTMQQREALEKHLPPQNIRRSLEACGKDVVQTIELAHRFKNGVEVVFNFSCRDPVEASTDLYYSRLSTRYQPKFDWTKPRCSTGRFPDIQSKLSHFASSFGVSLNDPTQIIIAVGMYVDESQSASGNVQTCPCWLWDLSLDPSARALEKENVHAFICEFPTITNLEYRYLDSHAGSPELARSKLTKGQKFKALLTLKRQAVEVLLKQLKAVEREGRKIQTAEGLFTVRVMLTCFVTDMKERRVMLGLRRGVYDCSHCYAFPGVWNEAETPRGNRSVYKDAAIRENFREEYRRLPREAKSGSIADEFKKAYGHLAIPYADECAFTQNKDSSIYFFDGPYEIFWFDALHGKDGIILYYCDFLEAFCGENFVDVTADFGNEFLKTKRFSMHVMERGIESFHFVPLALAFGKFTNPITDEERMWLFNGACDLLTILCLLTDPCPLFIVDKLEAMIARFKSHVATLLDRLKGTPGKAHKLTTKMHELFHHVADQVRRCGVPNAFSAKLFETFHQGIKELYQASSHRSGQGSASREVLLSHFYRQLISESASETTKAELVWSVRGSCAARFVPRFKISNDFSDKLLREAIERNLPALLRSVARASETNIDSICATFQVPENPALKNPKTFGNSLKMWIEDAEREVAYSGEAIAVVPGVHKGMYSSGGSYNAIVYHDALSQSAGTRYSWTNCPVEKCPERHHDLEFQLFCSAARDDTAAFAIPLVFFLDCVLAFKLEPISNQQARLPMSSVQQAEDPADFCGTTPGCEPALVNGLPAIFGARVTDYNKPVFVKYELIRGVCMIRPDYAHQEGTVFVFPGRGSFGHIILQ